MPAMMLNLLDRWLQAIFWQTWTTRRAELLVVVMVAVFVAVVGLLR